MKERGSGVCGHPILQGKSHVTTISSMPLDNAVIVVRVTTERRSIVGNDSTVGDHESRIQLLAFDFDRQSYDTRCGNSSNVFHSDARLIDIGGVDNSVLPSFVNLERLILVYMRYLQSGGHHVLFLPPEFDEDDGRSAVRFSLSSSKLTALDNIFGITAGDIDNYLSLLWFTCAFIARGRSETPEDRWDDKTSLARYRSWPDYKPKEGYHVQLKFGHPRATILCLREVLLHFTLSEVSFFTEDEVKNNLTFRRASLLSASSLACSSITIPQG